MTDLSGRRVQVNGVGLHVSQQGSGPLVLLCHGWPETAHAWRHQLPALAAQGYHAAAPDMRGFGRSDSPDRVEAFSLLHLVGDLVGLVAALGHTRAALVGHDWGAIVCWGAALLRPDVFHAVAGLSVPPLPRGSRNPIELLRGKGRADSYLVHFQQPDTPEQELERDVGDTLRRIYYSASAEGASQGIWQMTVTPDGGLLGGTQAPSVLPAWLGEEDLAVAVQAFTASGFRGGLNWYRNLARNWELTAPWHGLRIRVPALFVAGRQDTVVAAMQEADLHKLLGLSLADLRGLLLLDGCGHWVQQEKPAEVNRALVDFLAQVHQLAP